MFDIFVDTQRKYYPEKPSWDLFDILFYGGFAVMAAGALIALFGSLIGAMAWGIGMLLISIGAAALFILRFLDDFLGMF